MHWHQLSTDLHCPWIFSNYCPRYRKVLLKMCCWRSRHYHSSTPEFLVANEQATCVQRFGFFRMVRLVRGLVGAVEVSERLVLVVLMNVCGGIGLVYCLCFCPYHCRICLQKSPWKKQAFFCGRVLYRLCNFLKHRHCVSIFFEDFLNLEPKSCFGIS